MTKIKDEFCFQPGENNAGEEGNLFNIKIREFILVFENWAILDTSK